MSFRVCEKSVSRLNRVYKTNGKSKNLKIKKFENPKIIYFLIKCLRLITCDTTTKGTMQVGRKQKGNSSTAILG